MLTQMMRRVVGPNLFPRMRGQGLPDPADVVSHPDVTDDRAAVLRPSKADEDSPAQPETPKE